MAVYKIIEESYSKGQKFTSSGYKWEVLDQKGEYTLIYAPAKVIRPYVVAKNLSDDGRWDPESQSFNAEEYAQEYFDEVTGSTHSSTGGSDDVNKMKEEVKSLAKKIDPESKYLWASDYYIFEASLSVDEFMKRVKKLGFKSLNSPTEESYSNGKYYLEPSYEWQMDPDFNPDDRDKYDNNHIAGFMILPEDFTGEELPDLNESKRIFKEATGPQDYRVVTVTMDVAMPADQRLEDYGVGGGGHNDKLYSALSRALESVGLEMAGDYIDSIGDVTDVYKDNEYEFSFNETLSKGELSRSKVEIKESESSSDEVRIGRLDPDVKTPSWLTAKKLPSGKYSVKEHSPMGVFSVGTYTTLDPEKILRTYEKDPDINRRPEVDWDFDAIEKLKKS